MSGWHKKALSLKSLVHHSTNFFNGTGFCQHANNSYSRPLHHTDVPEIGAHQFWMHMTVLELMGIWHEIPDRTNLPPLLSPSVPWILWPWVFLSCPKSRQGAGRDWALGWVPARQRCQLFDAFQTKPTSSTNTGELHWAGRLPSNVDSHRQLYNCVVETAKCNLCPKLCLVVILLGGLRLAILQRWIRCCKYVSDW